MRKEYVITLTILILAVAFSMISGFHNEEADAVLEYNSQVCVYKNDELVQCSHNIVTDAGLNHLRDFLALGSAGSANASIIAVGNGSEPVAGSTSLNEEITGCALARAAGSYIANVSIGSWGITKLWTQNGCPGIIVNSTALLNATSGGTMFAGNTFTTVTLQNSDQLNVTWTIWVTSG
jgi:hypothetical protein